MTYKLASSIRSMVKNLNESWGEDHFCCGLVNEYNREGKWECHLYVKQDSSTYKTELYAIALGIQKAGCGLCIIETTYNKGTKKTDYVESICIF